MNNINRFTYLVIMICMLSPFGLINAAPPFIDNISVEVSNVVDVVNTEQPHDFHFQQSRSNLVGVDRMEFNESFNIPTGTILQVQHISITPPTNIPTPGFIRCQIMIPTSGFALQLPVQTQPNEDPSFHRFISASSPTVYVPQNPDYDDFMIGCGHTKTSTFVGRYYISVIGHLVQR